MKTIKETLHIYWRKDKFLDEGGKFFLSSSGGLAEYGYVYVCPYVVEVPEPEGFDPTATEVHQLREQLKKAGAEYHARVIDIQRQINELLAIDMSA